MKQDLPINKYLPSITQTLQQQNSLILQADPGAGKSTAVPLYLLANLDLSGKTIWMLEPRRLAAKSIAHYLADCLGEKVGQTIGYQIKNERKISSHTKLEIITEGILTNRLQHDPELADVGLIIFDEFHERSIHADLGLTLCQDIRQGFNESLKILVMSATIDTQQLSNFLDNAPIIISEGRCFPVSEHYLSKPVLSNQPRDWLGNLQKLILKAYNDSGKGDCLVFLPGQGEIKRVQNWLSTIVDSSQTVAYPLYGSLSAKQQQQAMSLDKQGRRKIILATNIAETSLTLPNITSVVDSGFERRSLYDVNSGMTRLIMQRISNAAAAQRQGRAGRLQAGACYRLWTSQQQKTLNEFSPEEIITTDLDALCLTLSQWGIKSFKELNWLTAPPTPHINASTSLLKKLALINNNNQLTTKGQQAVNFGVAPRFASLLATVATEPTVIQNLAADLVAVLSENNFLQTKDDADLVHKVMALQSYRQHKKQALTQYQLKPHSAEQALKTANNLIKKLNSPSQSYNLTQCQTLLAKLVATAFPDRIGKQRNPNSQRYQLTNGKGALLLEFDKLRPTAWLAIAELDGQKSDGRIYSAIEIDESTVEEIIGFTKHSSYIYNPDKNEILGKQSIKCGAILLAEKPLQEQDPIKMASCLQQAIKTSQLAILPWTKKLKSWLARINWLNNTASTQTDDWPSFESNHLFDDIEEWLFPYIENITSIKALQNIDLTTLLKARLPYPLTAELDKQAPESYLTPSNKLIFIDYSSANQATVSVVLQEIFGEQTSPNLAWGKVKLSFELLSPGKRPIQKTSDLANFWQSSYFEVIKDMKGQYPKHRWPDKPLEEKPGKSYQARKIRKVK